MLPCTPCLCHSHHLPLSTLSAFSALRFLPWLQTSTSTSPPSSTLIFIHPTSCPSLSPSSHLHPQTSHPFIPDDPASPHFPHSSISSSLCAGPVCAGGDGRSRVRAGQAEGEGPPPLGGTSSRQGLRPPCVPAVGTVPSPQQPNQGNASYHPSVIPPLCSSVLGKIVP